MLRPDLYFWLLRYDGCGHLHVRDHGRVLLRGTDNHRLFHRILPHGCVHGHLRGRDPLIQRLHQDDSVYLLRARFSFKHN